MLLSHDMASPTPATSLKTVWMVSGNKGGVGKSLLSLALIEVLRNRNQHVSVLDGDGRAPDVFRATARKIPSRSADFRNLRPDRHDNMEDGEYEALIYSLLAFSDSLVINTPDGADEVLLRWFDVTLRHTEAQGYRFKLLYVINTRPDGLDLLPELMDNFAFFYPVRNLFFGRTLEFVDFNQQFYAKFRRVSDFPVLRKQEVVCMTRGRYMAAEILCNMRHGQYEFPVLARQRVTDWLFNCTEMLNDIIDDDAANVMPASL